MYGIEVGETLSISTKINKHMLVPSFGEHFPAFAKMPPVLATIMVAAMIEDASGRLVHPRLAKHELISLGTKVDVRHIKAARGGDVTTSVELKDYDGKRLVFGAECRIGPDLIGLGTHHRNIVLLSELAKL